MFLPIFVVDAKKNFGYNFVAPLRFTIKLRFCEVELILLKYVNIMKTSEEMSFLQFFIGWKWQSFLKEDATNKWIIVCILENVGLSLTLLFIPDNSDSQALTFQKQCFFTCFNENPSKIWKILFISC